MKPTCKHQLLADKFRKFGSPSALPWIKCDECDQPVHHEVLRSTYGPLQKPEQK